MTFEGGWVSLKSKIQECCKDTVNIKDKKARLPSDVLQLNCIGRNISLNPWIITKTKKILHESGRRGKIKSKDKQLSSLHEEKKI